MESVTLTGLLPASTPQCRGSPKYVVTASDVAACGTSWGSAWAAPAPCPCPLSPSLAGTWDVPSGLFLGGSCLHAPFSPLQGRVCGWGEGREVQTQEGPEVMQAFGKDPASVTSAKLTASLRPCLQAPTY